MTVPILSAHINREGDVVVLAEDKTYLYAYKLTEAQQKKLLAKLGQVQQIDLAHWIEEIDIGETDEQCT